MKHTLVHTAVCARHFTPVSGSKPPLGGSSGEPTLPARQLQLCSTFGRCRKLHEDGRGPRSCHHDLSDRLRDHVDSVAVSHSFVRSSRALVATIPGVSTRASLAVVSKPDSCHSLCRRECSISASQVDIRVSALRLAQHLHVVIEVSHC